MAPAVHGQLRRKAPNPKRSSVRGNALWLWKNMAGPQRRPSRSNSSDVGPPECAALTILSTAFRALSTLSPARSLTVSDPTWVDDGVWSREPASTRRRNQREYDVTFIVERECRLQPGALRPAGFGEVIAQLQSAG